MMETPPTTNWLQRLQWWSKLSPENKVLTLLLTVAIAATIWSKFNIDERVRVYEERAIRAEERVDICHQEKTALELEFRSYMKEDKQRTESIKHLVDSTIKKEAE